MDTGLRRYDDVGVLPPPCHRYAYARDDKEEQINTPSPRYDGKGIMLLFKKNRHPGAGRGPLYPNTIDTGLRRYDDVGLGMRTGNNNFTTEVSQ